MSVASLSHWGFRLRLLQGQLSGDLQLECQMILLQLLLLAATLDLPLCSRKLELEKLSTWKHSANMVSTQTLQCVVVQGPRTHTTHTLSHLLHSVTLTKSCLTTNVQIWVRCKEIFAEILCVWVCVYMRVHRYWSGFSLWVWVLPVWFSDKADYSVAMTPVDVSVLQAGQNLLDYKLLSQIELLPIKFKF